MWIIRPSSSWIAARIYISRIVGVIVIKRQHQSQLLRSKYLWNDVSIYGVTHVGPLTVTISYYEIQIKNKLSDIQQKEKHMLLSLDSLFSISNQNTYMKGPLRCSDLNNRVPWLKKEMHFLSLSCLKTVGQAEIERMLTWKRSVAHQVIQRLVPLKLETPSGSKPTVSFNQAQLQHNAGTLLGGNCIRY